MGPAPLHQELTDRASDLDVDAGNQIIADRRAPGPVSRRRRPSQDRGGAVVGPQRRRI